MAVALSVAGQYVADFFTDAIRVGVENARIHIALQGDLVTGELACIGEVDGPGVVARGVVAVLVSDDGGPPARVASLHAGDFFGEMALL